MRKIIKNYDFCDNCKANFEDVFCDFGLKTDKIFIKNTKKKYYLIPKNKKRCKYKSLTDKEYFQNIKKIKEFGDD